MCAAGGSPNVALPWDTSLENEGSYTIGCTVKTKTGQVLFLTSTFTIVHGVPITAKPTNAPATAPPVNTKEDSQKCQDKGYCWCNAPDPLESDWNTCVRQAKFCKDMAEEWGVELRCNDNERIFGSVSSNEVVSNFDAANTCGEIVLSVPADKGIGMLGGIVMGRGWKIESGCDSNTTPGRGSCKLTCMDDWRYSAGSTDAFCKTGADGNGSWEMEMPLQCVARKSECEAFPMPEHVVPTFGCGAEDKSCRMRCADGYEKIGGNDDIISCVPYNDGDGMRDQW